MTDPKKTSCLSNLCNIAKFSLTLTLIAAQYMTNLKQDTKLTSAILVMSLIQLGTHTDPSIGAHDIHAISATGEVAGIEASYYRADLL